MARERTKDEIIDQAIWALQCVSRHYGPAFNDAGLVELRQKLSEFDWWCDGGWRVDTLDGDGEPNPDFCPKFIPEVYCGQSFKETVGKSLSQ